MYMEKRASLLGVLQTLYRWRKQILIISAGAAIGTALISLALPNYFKATTVFYAASPDLAKPEILFNRGNQLRSFYYGGENDIDRILTIGESSALIDFMVDSFHLYEIYQINPEHPKAIHRVREEFLELYELKKNKRDALELSMEDKDAERSARMANTAREKINSLASQLIKKNQRRTLQAYRENIARKEKQLVQMGDSLAVVRGQFDIYNITAQSELLTSQASMARAALAKNRRKLEVLKSASGIRPDTIAFLRATVGGMETQVDSLESQVDRFRKGMARVMNLEKQYIDANQTLSEDRERAKQLQATVDSDIPALILVEEAQTPIIKSRPKRSIMVIAAGAIAFLFSVIGILLFEAYRDIDWRKILHDS